MTAMDGGWTGGWGGWQRGGNAQQGRYVKGCQGTGTLLHVCIFMFSFLSALFRSSRVPSVWFDPVWQPWKKTTATTTTKTVGKVYG